MKSTESNRTMSHQFNLLLLIAALVGLSSFDVTVASSPSLAASSMLNLHELQHFKYQIAIEDSLRLESSAVQSESTDQLQPDQMPATPTTKRSQFVPMRSIYGQNYECVMPDDLLLESDASPSGSNVDTGSGASEHNFTLINETVVNYLQSLKNSRECIYRNTGWWTYEFCFGSHIDQYHLSNEGLVVGERISLGNFSADFDWSAVDKTAIENGLLLPTYDNIFYHEQYYRNGSVCELSGLPRRTLVKLFCDEKASKKRISIVSEIETCVYEIHIASRGICSIPNFSKKSNNYEIACHPVASKPVYEQFISEKRALDAAAAALGVQMGASNVQLEETAEHEALSSSSSSSSSKTPPATDTAEASDEGILENPELMEELSSKLKEIFEQLNLDVSQKDIDIAMADLQTNKPLAAEAKQEKSEEKEDVDDEEGDDDNGVEIVEEATKASKKYKVAMVKKTKKNKNKSTKTDKKSSSSSSMIEPNGDEKLKSLERELEEKLFGEVNADPANKLNKKQFKVKIVRMDPNQMLAGGGAAGFAASDDDAGSLNSLIGSLLQSDYQYERAKRYQANYKLVHDAAVGTTTSKHKLVNHEDVNTRGDEDDTFNPLIIF